MARVRKSIKRIFRKIICCWPKPPYIPPADPSTANDQVLHEHSRDSVPFAPLIPSSPPSITVTPEGPTAVGGQHVHEMSGDSFPSESPSNHQEPLAEQSLWNRAYDALAKENPRLVKEYDELLEREQMANPAPYETTPSPLPPYGHDTRSDRSPRQVQLDTVIRNGLRRMDGNRATYTIAGHEFDLTSQITEAAHLLLWGRDWIGTAVKNSPEASIVWSGVSLVIPLLTDPIIAAEANQDGFVYVTSRLRYYVALEPMVRRLGLNASVNKALVTAANDHLLNLYQAILDFQLSSVLRFYQSRLETYILDIFSSKDWAQAVRNIKTREQILKNDLSLINDLAATQELERLNRTSEKLHSEMGAMLSVAARHLAVAEKQLAAEEERNLAKQRKAQRECLQAFLLTDNDNDATYDWYKDRVKSRVEGTGKWFLEHENFQKWLLEESGSLLVSADPGCGKSVLAKYLIDDGLAKQSATICYFFFKDQDQNTIRQALCALLHQLFSQKRTLIRHAMELYNDMGAKLVQSEPSLWKILGDAVRDPQAGPVIFVFDALDECDESQVGRLMRNLENMFRDQQLANARFKVLMTSRPYEQVVSKVHSSLQDDFPRAHIPGEEELEAISQEINGVIQHRVQQLAKSHRLSDKVKSSLNSKLLATEHRTYLWAHLVFDDLDERFTKGLKRTESGIDAAIRTLPTTVNQAYDQILNRSQEVEVVETVKRALSIILAARRPLTLTEMNIAMSLDGQFRGQSICDLDLERDVDFKSRLRALCGLFVNVYKGKIDFIHQTAREFLIQSSTPATISPSLQWQYSITTRHAHSLLADICMFYLDWLNSTHTETFRQGDHHDILLDYSVEYWGDHCREAEFDKGSAMVELASRLCTPDWASNSQWTRIFSKRYDIRSGSSTNVLVASRLGLTPVTELLLSRGADVEERDIDDWTALMLAAGYGHEAVVRLLLENGADVEARGSDGRGALMLAVTNDRESITRLLLENRADTEARNDDGMTPLMLAAQYGHEAVARVLLNNGANVEAEKKDGTTALMLTTEFGRERVTRLLLEYSPNIEARNGDGWTALTLAVQYGYEAILRVLLEKGADVESAKNDGTTALTLAAEFGHIPLTRLLLEKGANVEVKKKDGKSALMLAAEYGHEAVARLLLKKGADILEKDNEGWVALMSAARSGHEAVARLLLEKGANAEAKMNDGRTVLMIAAQYGHEGIARVLFEHGANVETEKNDGTTALMLAAEYGRERVTQLLLDKCADTKYINAKDNEDWTALSFAAFNGHKAVAQLLLERGADVEARNDLGHTALSSASAAGREAVARLLLSVGANVEARDNDGWTTLMQAAESGRDAVARLLLENGADIKARDNDGKTALTYAAENGHEAATRLLLDKGADVEARDNNGLTALMLAAAKGHEAIIRLLLEYGAQDEAKDVGGDVQID